MRVVLSRKGFDSSTGGCPSPIVGGRPVSLPIPTSRRSESCYDALGLGEIVRAATRGRIAGGHPCHEDPMFADGLCAFGQTGAAQSHLARRGVGAGDVFLFFGLFADEGGGEPHHRIFAYLQVESRISSGATPAAWDGPSFPRRHPHTIGEWGANNTLYVGPGAACRRAALELRLTVPGGPPSLWQVPPWLREVGLSYHARPNRWLPNNRLKTVGRGQEFVADIGGRPEARRWLEEVIEAIET
jgi:hypothetical protein